MGMKPEVEEVQSNDCYFHKLKSIFNFTFIDKQITSTARDKLNGKLTEYENQSLSTPKCAQFVNITFE